MAHDQTEFDFAAPRQQRIRRALSSTPAVSRAVPLSDTDKLMLAGMDALAQQVVDEVQGLTLKQSRKHIDARITAFVASLGTVSPEFGRETTRYLREAISRNIREQHD